MYGDVVMGVQKLPSEDHDPFEAIIEDLKKKFSQGKGEVDDSRITTDQMKELVSRFKALVKKGLVKIFLPAHGNNLKVPLVRFSVHG